MQKDREQRLSRMLRTEIKKYLSESIDTKARMLKTCIPDIEKGAMLIAASLVNGNKILLCGNGGSAADAQHLAAEFIVRLTAKRERPSLPAIALTTDTSILTACANDYGFDDVFARQVEGLGMKGDVLIGITTSGNSPNVIKAMNAGKKHGLKIIGLLGGSGGNALPHCDVPIIIPAEITHFVQEGHLAVEHLLCSLTESIMFDRLSTKSAKSKK